MPAAPHWPTLTVLAAATVALLRRRAAGEVTAVVATRVASVDDILAQAATPNLVFSYAFNGCPDGEIADRFGLTDADLRAIYAEVLTKGRAQRAYALRKAQSELATGTVPGGGKPTGNGPMLTWLGRNELGQSLSPALPGQPEPDLAPL